MRTSRLFVFPTLAVLGLLVGALGAASCGGGGGGAGPDGAGQGLILLSFLQAGKDNTSINTPLEFRFSEAVNPETITNASIQIRSGPTFGLTADGTFVVDGDRVFFEPRLPGECGYEDAGLEPGTTYRVTLLGAPEAFAVQNTKGQPLESTVTYTFVTLPQTDPDFLADQIPGEAPRVLDTVPAAGTTAISIAETTGITVDLSENIDPCTLVDGTTVRLRVFEVGDRDLFLEVAQDRFTGFDPIEDSLPNDPYSWGGNATPLTQPQRLASELMLHQTQTRTTLSVRPVAGRFPDNCLMVLELGGGILDFGGTPLPPTTISFTTENLVAGESTLVVEYDSDTPIDTGATTADVNTTRSPSRVQAWISYGGDGDNGPAPIELPSFPTLNPGDLSVDDCAKRENDGTKDDFEPTSDVTLYTGSELIDSSCTNSSDGSTAVVFEFSSFHIPSGVTVTIQGENPAIILVNGNAVIDAGGELRVRGSQGGTGSASCNAGGAAGAAGAGGGPGGQGGYQQGASSAYGEDGMSGYGSASPYARPGDGGGEGGVAYLEPAWWGGSGVGGGGGGHAIEGSAGQSTLSGSGGSHSWAASPVGGGGGGIYPLTDEELYQPAAGSGGAGGGAGTSASTWSTTSCFSGSSGGSGGGGGGFVSITTSGNIEIHGFINAAGGAGGTGGTGSYSGGGGGGGGSGGAVRLLCSGDIDLTGATITAAGGAAGTGTVGSYAAGGGTTGGPFYANNGGAGGHGRIILEDGDSVITGINSANLTPAEGQDGFYRSSLAPSRFVEGGSEAVATTLPVALGGILDAASVTFPSLTEDDFIAGVPSASSVGIGETVMVIEMQGFLATPGAEVDETTPTGWYVVGYFTDFGVPSRPKWFPNAAPSGFPIDAGTGIGQLNGRSAFVQIRTTLYMAETASPEQPGPFVDRMNIRYTADN